MYIGPYISEFHYYSRWEKDLPLDNLVYFLSSCIHTTVFQPWSSLSPTSVLSQLNCVSYWLHWMRFYPSQIGIEHITQSVSFKVELNLYVVWNEHWIQIRPLYFPITIPFAIDEGTGIVLGHSGEAQTRDPVIRNLAPLTQSYPLPCS